MSSAPTGSVVPSIAAILAASRWARVTPRVRSPTKVTSLAQPLRSRISWAIQVSARSRAEASSTSAFSRKRDEREVIILSLRASQGPLKGKRKIDSNVTLLGRPQPLLAVLRGLHAGAFHLEHELEHVARVGVVLDDEDRHSLEARPAARRRRARDRFGARQRELVAKARAVAQAGGGDRDAA